MVTRAAPLLALGLFAGCGPGREMNAQQPPASAGARAPANQAIDVSRRTAVVDAAARIAPAVVSIRATLPQPRQTPFDYMFGQRQGGVSQSYGTGFILRDSGIVITNQHVIANGQQVTVTLRDGTDLPARVLGQDPLTDIAVLKVERRGLPTGRVGRSADLMIGEWAIALGNPYAYLLGNAEPSVTVGVISATGRNIVPTGELSGEYLDMIQTDAAINPGNSGGPLVNALGEVIGLNSSIFSNTGESVGLGFAIPIERVVRVADEIIKNGSVGRAWPGLEVATASPTGELKQNGGLPVLQVAPGGPADKAGLREGDVLVTANGRTLRNYLDWEAVKLDLHVGDTIVVTTAAAGRTLTRRIVTGDLPSVTAQRVRIAGDVEVVSVSPGIRAQYQLQRTEGAVIAKISNETARATGLREGDLVFAAGRTPIRRAEDFRSALDTFGPGTQFQLAVERRGNVFGLWLQK